MSDQHEKIKTRPEDVIWDLWRIWAVALGSLVLPLLLSVWISEVWISVLTLIEACCLNAAINRRYHRLVGYCSLVLRIASRVLFVTAAIMLLIVILCTDWLVPTVIHLQVYNQQIPFITALIIFPVIIVVCIMWLYMGLGDRHCRECQRRFGYYAGDSIGATLYYRETRYQVFIMMLLSVSVGAIEYWYYFVRYINSDLNTPDRFFFNYLPAVVYLISLLFMFGRYANMKALYNSIEATRVSKRNKTVIRFLIFSGDDLLLHKGTDGLYDTPAEAVVDRTQSIGDHQARLLFEELMAIRKFELHYCFTNDGFVNDSNIIHYTVFLDDEERGAVDEEDTWFNAYMIDSALASNSISPVLANEIFRIHTIAMTWKTYDRTGKRLYPIRHYRPTFRFRDMPEWDVDYDDMRWFDIAKNNEDRRFYRLRRLYESLTGQLRRTGKADAR